VRTFIEKIGRDSLDVRQLEASRFWLISIVDGPNVGVVAISLVREDASGLQ
jgi:hypothetical protein